MAHFALVGDDNIVIMVTPIDNKDCDDLPFPASEAVGQAFIASLGIEGRWLQSSYNASFRKNAAAVGFFYDEALDAFVPPKPGDGWTQDPETLRWIDPNGILQPDGKKMW